MSAVIDRINTGAEHTGSVIDVGSTCSGMYYSGEKVDPIVAAKGCLQMGSAVTSNMPILPAALGLVSNAIDGGVNCYNAQKTIAGLKKCLDDAQKGKYKDLAEILQRCIERSERKSTYGAMNASIVGQLPTTITRIARGAWKACKGTKGTERKYDAEKLYAISQQRTWWGHGWSTEESKIAKEAISALCGAQFEEFIKKSLADAMKT